MLPGGTMPYSKEYKPFRHKVQSLLRRRPLLLWASLITSLVLVWVAISSCCPISSGNQEGKLNASSVELKTESPNNGKRRDSVVLEFKHAWSAYETYAFGFDDVHPFSRTGSQSYHMALTMIDSLDSLILLGLEEELTRSVSWLRHNWNLNSSTEVSVFETTIRVIGGFLGAFHLSNTPDHRSLFLRCATLTADKLLPAFKTASGIPLASVDISTGRAYGPSWGQGKSSVSEVGSIQLEWQDLSRVTGNMVYAEVVNKAMEKLIEVQPSNGLYTRFIQPQTGQLSDGTVTLGARVDSVYEYMLKLYLYNRVNNANMLESYLFSVNGISSKLRKVTPNGMTYISEMDQKSEAPIAKMVFFPTDFFILSYMSYQDHLVCFISATLALGSKYLSADLYPRKELDLVFAKEIANTCIEAYTQMPTGLAPEIFRFSPELIADPGAKHNLLRPETIESLFIMWRTTHDEVYRDHAWNIFQSFVKHCRLPDRGYVGLKDVTVLPLNSTSILRSDVIDHMESFFLAETLKYFYLIFSEDTVLSLDKYVLNTEAHPIAIPMK